MSELQINILGWLIVSFIILLCWGIKIDRWLTKQFQYRIDIERRLTKRVIFISKNNFVTPSDCNGMKIEFFSTRNK